MISKVKRLTSKLFILYKFLFYFFVKRVIFLEIALPLWNSLYSSVCTANQWKFKQQFNCSYDSIYPTRIVLNECPNQLLPPWLSLCFPLMNYSPDLRDNGMSLVISDVTVSLRLSSRWKYQLTRRTPAPRWYFCCVRAWNLSLRCIHLLVIMNTDTRYLGK